ncbi:hypothetical protein BDV98DRAFT_603619 [Pterulicium gracile]|uniref:Thioesterase domain-containing protein n=1 Tax=Pterulicium gracile TaxID=1884261 RepID=A0A5C3QNL6_9AGAR|nr:hypothetical protein BDV98DRAFT_603619 [Pterula gracilis]
MDPIDLRVQKKVNTIPDALLDSIKGNVPKNVKAVMSHILWFYAFDKPTTTRFGDRIGLRTRTTEIDLFDQDTCDAQSSSDSRSMRMVCEVDVVEDMVNYEGTLHSGCIAYLMDMCTSVALVGHSMLITGRPAARVSLALSITYLHPVPLGAKLKVVCITPPPVSANASVLGEIWDVTNNRLAAIAEHGQMSPSAPIVKQVLPLKASL